MGTKTELYLPEFNKKNEEILSPENENSLSADNVSDKLAEKADEMKEFDEMGNNISENDGLTKGKEILNLKINPGGSAPNNRPDLLSNSSSIEVNNYGLKNNTLSYKNNFPYNSDYLKKVNSRDYSNIKPLTEGKGLAFRSQITLPEKKTTLKEGYGFFERAVAIIKNHVENENKDVPYLSRTRDDTYERGSKKIHRVNNGNLEVDIKPDALEINNMRQYNLNLDKEKYYDESFNSINTMKNNYNFK
tara:strand:+ start:1106 stop:1846 length:741 start_codon:yes stop_codon:yes gene_type:complete